MLELNSIRQLAAEAGFDDCSAANACRLDDDARHLALWLQAGCHGTMHYMAEHFDKRVDPRLLVPGCRTVIVCLLSYYKSCRQPEGAPSVALNGLSRCDYHTVLKSRLLRLENMLRSHFGNDLFDDSHQHLFCDSAPVLERRWAQRAGLGWIGRNRQFIHPSLGSFVHIGILMLQQPLPNYGTPLDGDPCSECTICIEKCPTGALRGDLFDARKCVSYLTIERKEPLDDKYRAVVENVAYGCDLCASSCPHNKELAPTRHEELLASPALLNMTRDEWNALSRRRRLKLLGRLAKD